MKSLIRKHPLFSFFVIAYAIAFGTTFTGIFLAPERPAVPWSLEWFLNAYSPKISALIVAAVSGGFIAGTLGLLPPMVLYIAAGSLLVLTVEGVVAYSGVRTLSRKPDQELNFLRSARLPQDGRRHQSVSVNL